MAHNPSPETPLQSPSQVVVYQPTKMTPSLAFLPGEHTAEHVAAVWGLGCLKRHLEDEADERQHQQVLQLLESGDTDEALAVLEHALQGKFITLTVWDPKGEEDDA